MAWLQFTSMPGAAPMQTPDQMQATASCVPSSNSNEAVHVLLPASSYSIDAGSLGHGAPSMQVVRGTTGPNFQPHVPVTSEPRFPFQVVHNECPAPSAPGVQMVRPTPIHHAAHLHVPIPTVTSVSLPVQATRALTATNETSPTPEGAKGKAKGRKRQRPVEPEESYDDPYDRRRRDQIGRGCACWVCHYKKTKCDGETPCGRCKYLGFEDDCRDNFLWEPYPKYREEPAWNLLSNLRYGRTNEHIRQLVVLDKLARNVIQTYVSCGELQENECVDFTSLAQMRKMIEGGFNDADVHAFMLLGQRLIKKLDAKEAQPPNDFETAKVCWRASRLSIPFLESFRDNAQRGADHP